MVRGGQTPRKDEGGGKTSRGSLILDSENRPKGHIPHCGRTQQGAWAPVGSQSWREGRGREMGWRELGGEEGRGQGAGGAPV